MGIARPARRLRVRNFTVVAANRGIGKAGYASGGTFALIGWVAASSLWSNCVHVSSSSSLHCSKCALQILAGVEGGRARTDGEMLVEGMLQAKLCKG